VQLARQNHLPHQEFLTVVLADEVARRERRSATTRARTARLDATMTMEGWDESTDAVYDRDLWAELCTLRFVEDRRDLVIMGPVGVGKTFMASALGHVACRRRHTTLMARTDQLLKRLRASRLDGTHDTELRRLIRLEMLILDDFCLQALDDTDTADVYELIVERHRRASTIVTTNREPPAEWLAAMADPLLAEAAIDRLTSNAYQLVVDGPSYRQRQRPGREPHPGPPGGGPTPASKAGKRTAAGVKAKPSGRPPADLDPGSPRPQRRRS
jgi:DNA replication protein DnaC